MLALAGGTVVLGGVMWALYPFFRRPSPAMRTEMVGSRAIVAVTDEVFESTDNLFVFFLDKQEEVKLRRDEVQRVVLALDTEPPLHHLKYYYNVRKEGDPQVPDTVTKDAAAAAGEESQADGSDGTAPAKKGLQAVMYKGQRKAVVQIDSETGPPKQEVLDFFKPRSEELPEGSRELVVPRVSGRSFHKDVIQASSPEKIIILQLFEDTCFLCFLMRPFVNAVAKMFQERGIPVTFKRLNVEKNDFPFGCPVSRGTPTFVLYKGISVPPAKWDEFRPKEVVEKLMMEVPLSGELADKMEVAQQLLQRRLDLFMQVVMWSLEVGKLEALHATSGVEQLPLPPPIDEEKDSSEFNQLVAKMMQNDMARTDDIHENLEYLQKQVFEVESDAALLGVFLGEEVLRRERKS